ncbi:unnamed protein product [Gadus morhua 'NCC']
MGSEELKRVQELRELLRRCWAKAEECVTLADDIGYMACKFFPVSRIATECLEEENVEKNEDILKADNCRRTLEHLFKMMKANWAEFNLATHGLGPYVLKTTCVLIDSCLAEKLKLLKIDK